MPRHALTALVLVAGLALLSAIRPVWAIDPDAGLYVGLARSLAAGDGYALDGVPHTKYPPGLPFVLSLVVRVGGPEAYAGFHAVLVVALLASGVLAAAVATRLGAPPPVALAVALATLASQTLFDLSVTYVRSEAPFLALSLAALACLWRAQQPGARGWTWVAAAALVAAATLTRLAGITLLAVPALALVRRGVPARSRVGPALVLATGLAVIAAWQARANDVAGRFPGAPDYGSEFLAAEPRDLTKTVCLDLPRLDADSLRARVAGNLEVMARAVAVLLSNVDRAGSRLVVGFLALLLVLAGLISLGLQRAASSWQRQAAAYVAATLALYLVWPFNQQERFYVPLLPLLLLAAGAGLLRLRDLVARAWERPAARRAGLVAGGALWLLLAVQRSDHPVILGRWSAAYAGLLGTGVAGLALLATLRRVPELRPGLALAAAVALALPWAQRRFVEWPAQVAAFEARRAANPQPGPLARVDVDPRLEAVAAFLRDHTPPGTVLMTDVPSILQPLSGRRCMPFVYRRAPPQVEFGEADLVFYTRELPDAAAAMDAASAGLQPALELEPVWHEGQLIRPTVWKAP